MTPSLVADLDRGQTQQAVDLERYIRWQSTATPDQLERYFAALRLRDERKGQS
jgi:hypothetical protein